jgi:hypothetical protein
MPWASVIAARAASGIRERRRRHGCCKRKHGAQERTETLRLPHGGLPSVPQFPPQPPPWVRQADTRNVLTTDITGQSPLA